jgi:acyl-coenzyme A thioesterase PaaI-like protein
MLKKKMSFSKTYLLSFHILFLFCLADGNVRLRRRPKRGEHSKSQKVAPVKYGAFADIPYEQEHLDVISRLLQPSGGGGAAAGGHGGGYGGNSILDDTRDCHNNTHLHAAARTGRADAVAKLVHNGANVNVRNAYGESPLYLAALFRHTAIVTCLLEQGADMAIANTEDGNTPLHVAALWGQLAAVEQLCRFGGFGSAAITARNKGNKTPLDLAKSRRIYLEKRRIGNPVATIRLLEERQTGHAYKKD